MYFLIKYHTNKKSGIIEFFTVYTKLAEMQYWHQRTLKKLPPVGLDLMPGIITGL